jgi:hypothetical protein
MKGKETRRDESEAEGGDERRRNVIFVASFVAAVNL